MVTALSDTVLGCENRRFIGTGGRSEENRGCGFRPAFMDTQTRSVYASCFRDGQPAPFHLLDGLPDEVVLTRLPSGKVLAVKDSVVSGFIRDGCFLTREEAAARVSGFEASICT